MKRFDFKSITLERNENLRSYKMFAQEDFKLVIFERGKGHSRYTSVDCPTPWHLQNILILKRNYNVSLF